MDNGLNHFNGIQIIIAKPLKCEIKRTWKQRLFSLPFKPFETHRIEWHETIKDGQVIEFQDKLTMNAHTYKAFKQTIA